VEQSAFRRLILPGTATVVAFAILVSLGLWQLQRLQWKEALIARVTSRMDAAPVSAPGPASWSGLDLADLEYQPVTVSGRFQNDKEVDVVYALTEPRGPVGGIGYMIMTPFLTDHGWLVYVNRGFVPKDRKSADTRKEGLIDGETTVTGLIRQPAPRSWYMPNDGVSNNEWMSRDPAAYARAYGNPLAKVAPYLIDAKYDPNLPGGLPQSGETIVSFPNNHFQYALTWFGLAAALVGVFGFFAQARLGGRS
jgi:surfeit locus 1 family protein